MQNPRRLAAEALLRIERGGYPNLVLPSLLNHSGLSPRERAFATRIAYGATERRRTLDARLSPHLKKPLSRLDAEVRAVLRAGLYQILYMDAVPVPAAVNESVKLVRAMGKSSAAGMVNAVLRRAAAPWQPVFESELQRLAVQYSVSDEIAALLWHSYGPGAEKILAASHETPRLIVRVNTLRTSAQELQQELQQQGVKTRETELPNALELLGAGDVTALKAFQAGLFHVQGLASQLAVQQLAVQPGQRVVDLCAAPGGKAATMAQQMQNTGELLCGDAASGRLPLIEDLLSRLGISCASVQRHDATRPFDGGQGAQRVLCDVPCSGLGVLAKKPDIRYKDLADLPGLIDTQKKILEQGAALLAVGGRLVYSTCTVNPAENGDVVRDFLAQNKAFRLCEVAPQVEGARVEEGMATFLPGEADTDGFFVASLERVW